MRKRRDGVNTRLSKNVFSLPTDLHFKKKISSTPSRPILFRPLGFLVTFLDYNLPLKDLLKHFFFIILEVVENHYNRDIVKPIPNPVHTHNEKTVHHVIKLIWKY